MNSMMDEVLEQTLLIISMAVRLSEYDDELAGTLVAPIMR